MSDTAPPGPGGERASLLSAELDERDVDVLLVATPTNLRYLTGFTGSNGLALLAAEGAGHAHDGRHRFFTDFRYAIQSAEQLPESFEREIVTGNLLEAAATALQGGEGVSASTSRA